MSITWNNIFVNNEALKDYVYNMLKALEAGGVANWLQPKPMGGTSGITIGIGFDLKNCLPATRLAVLQAMGLQTDLRKKDPATLSTSEKIEIDYVNRLLNAVQGASIAAVNAIMAERANDSALKAAMAAENKNYELRSSFYFKDESEVRWAYDNGGFDDYSKQVNDKIGSIVAGDPNFILSQERAALVVVDWLLPALVPGAEIKDGNRAEAWFKIRYGWSYKNPKNEQYFDGWAKRHYLESQIFGLYDDPDNVSLTEARSVYQMFQSHRKEISDREKKFGEKFDGTDGTRNMISEGNNDSNYKLVLSSFGLERIETITQALDPAKSKVLSDLRSRYKEFEDKLQDSAIKSTNIYMNPAKPGDTTPSILDAEPYETTSAGENNVMIGNDSRDTILGGAGNDILIGEGGNDYLEGGKGDDVLIGGSGFDTYYYTAGDGADQISDTGENQIIIEDANGKIEVIKTFYKTGDNIWTTADGKIEITHHSPWQIVLEDGSTLILGENFQDGDIGIHLKDVPANPTTTHEIVEDNWSHEPFLGGIIDTANRHLLVV